MVQDTATNYFVQVTKVPCNCEQRSHTMENIIIMGFWILHFTTLVFGLYYDENTPYTHSGIGIRYTHAMHIRCDVPITHFLCGFVYYMRRAFIVPRCE